MFRSSLFSIAGLLLVSYVQAAFIAGNKGQRGTLSVNSTPNPSNVRRPPGRIDDFAANITPSPSPKPNPGGSFCDIFDQDCPSGFKCVPEELGGVPKCRRLDNSPHQIGEDCSTNGENDGDSCETNGICVNGICRELCRGSKQLPQCDHPQAECHIYQGGTGLCERTCDPIIHNICKHKGGPGTFCTMDSTSPHQQFTCMPKPNGLLGMFGESCTKSSQCRQGSVCMLKTVLPNGFCHNSGTLKCCTPLAEDSNDCPSGMILQPFYQSPPPGLEDLGVCVL